MADDSHKKDTTLKPAGHEGPRAPKSRQRRTTQRRNNSPSLKKRPQKRALDDHPTKKRKMGNNERPRVWCPESCSTDDTALNQIEWIPNPNSHCPQTSDELLDRSGEASKKRGRKPKPETLLLNDFHPVSKYNTFKKDNLRTRLLRGHNRFLKKIRTRCDAFPTRVAEDLLSIKSRNSHKVRPDLNYFDQTNQAASHLLWKSISRYQWDPMLFDSIIDAPPKIDKEKEFPSPLYEPEASYCNSYCEKYFREPKIVQSYLLYIKLLFLDKNTTSLCARFGVLCCDKACIETECTNQAECLDKWSELEHFLGSEDFLFKSK